MRLNENAQDALHDRNGEVKSDNILTREMTVREFMGVAGALVAVGLSKLGVDSVLENNEIDAWAKKGDFEYTEKNADNEKYLQACLEYAKKDPPNAACFQTGIKFALQQQKNKELDLLAALALEKFKDQPFDLGDIATMYLQKGPLIARIDTLSEGEAGFLKKGVGNELDPEMKGFVQPALHAIADRVEPFVVAAKASDIPPDIKKGLTYAMDCLKVFQGILETEAPGSKKYLQAESGILRVGDAVSMRRFDPIVTAEFTAALAKIRLDETFTQGHEQNLLVLRGETK